MFGKKSDDDRFEVIYKQGGLGSFIKIIRDRDTGVNYLLNVEGYAGGLCVLVDKDGKPIISK